MTQAEFEGPCGPRAPSLFAIRMAHLAIWAAIVGSSSVLGIMGLLNVHHGELVFHIPRRMVCVVQFNLAALSVAAGFLLATLCAFHGGARRAVADLAGRYSSALPLLVFSAIVGIAWRMARMEGRMSQFALGSAFLGAAALFFMPRAYQRGVLWKCRGALAFFRDLTPIQTALGLGMAGFVILLSIKLLVYGTRPIAVDESGYLFLARIFARGRLSLPLPDFPEFFVGPGIITQGRWTSMYPPVHPALLALGLKLGVPWAVGPLTGGACVALVWLAGAKWRGRRTGWIAALLLLSSPHWVVMGPTEMSHGTTAMWLALALAALTWSLDKPAVGMGALGGLAFGLACATRPLTGLAAGMPLVVAYAAAQWRFPGRWRALGAAAGAALSVAALMLVYNYRTTGSAWTLGYNQLFPELHVGFGGPTNFTPAEAVWQSLDRLWRLASWGPGGFPCVYVFLGLWVLFAPRDRMGLALMGMWASLPAAHFFYYHIDKGLGPRFMYETSVPGALLASAGLECAWARLAAMVRPAARRRVARRAFLASGVALALAGSMLCEQQLGEARFFHLPHIGLQQWLRQFDGQTDVAVFIEEKLFAVAMDDNVNYPAGPLHLLHRGEIEDRRYIEAHPGWKFYFCDGDYAGPYEEAPLERRMHVPEHAPGKI